MTMQELKIFEEKQIRTIWDEVQEKWYFCVADIISALSDNTDVKQYTKRLRQRDPELGIQQSLMDYKRLGYSDNWINQRLLKLMLISAKR